MDTVFGLERQGNYASFVLLAHIVYICKPEKARDNPCYPASRQTFISHGAKLFSLDVDKDGTKIDALIAQQPKVEFLYSTPSHQDPTGSILTLRRREKLVHWAKKANTIIIESDIDTHFRYGTKPLPALQALDNQARVLYLSSFWSIMGPLARFGFFVLPLPLISLVQHIQELMGPDVSALEQVCMADFINEGHFERFVQKTKQQYTKKRQVLFYCLKSNFGDLVNMQSHGSGTHLVACFADCFTENTLLASAQEAGLILKTSRPYYMKNPKGNEFLIPFAPLNESAIFDILNNFASRVKARSPA